MIRITKITDHGIVLLTHFARSPLNTVFNARDLASRERMSLPMVSKILKILSGCGLLQSHRGVKGGYSLSRTSDAISLAEIVSALEGRIALTDCSDEAQGSCDREAFCNVGGHWKIINRIILESMQDVTLKDLAFPPGSPEAGPSPLGGNHGQSRNDGRPGCPSRGGPGERPGARGDLAGRNSRPKE